jgi:uncharacterized protein
MRNVIALLCGLLFGVGLAVSGMMDPAKVVGFLDFAGDWDPTLLFVMGGALLVSGPGFLLALRRRRPVLESSFDLPTKTRVDGRLLSGAAVFGLGWGLSGFCPGPAVAALSTGLPPVLAFLAAMAAGMLLFAATAPDAGAPRPGRSRRGAEERTRVV